MKRQNKKHNQTTEEIMYRMNIFVILATLVAFVGCAEHPVSAGPVELDDVVEDTAEGSDDVVEDTAEGSGDVVEDTAEGSGDVVEDTAEGSGDVVEDTSPPDA